MELRMRGARLTPPLADTAAEALRPLMARYVCADLAATALAAEALGQWERIQRARDAAAQRRRVTVPARGDAGYREWVQVPIEALHAMVQRFARGECQPAARARVTRAAAMAQFYRRGGAEPALADF